MEPLARWIRREFEWAVPWQVYVSFSVGLLLALWLAFRYLLDFNWIWVPASVMCLALGLLPGVVHSRKTRHRVKLSGLVLASRRGHLSEAIGPRAAELNEAALDLEQIITILRQGGDDALDRTGLMAQAKERFAAHLIYRSVRLRVIRSRGKGQSGRSKRISNGSDKFDSTARSSCSALSSPKRAWSISMS